MRALETAQREGRTLAAAAAAAAVVAASPSAGLVKDQ